LWNAEKIDFANFMELLTKVQTHGKDQTHKKKKKKRAGKKRIPFPSANSHL